MPFAFPPSTISMTTSTPTTKHPSGPPRHGFTRQVLRLFEFLIWFNLCAAVIHTNQLIMALFYFVNKDYFNAFMTYTKQQFGIVISTVTQWFTPTLIRVSGDASVAGQITRSRDGRLVTKFPERLVLMSNHQIYTEWLYLWWFAYTSGQHGSIYIILKESLKYIPVIGPAMSLYGFIFMARNWAKDKIRLQYRLQKLKSAHAGPLSGSKGLDPMWLLIFPEGTNLSANTRKRSAAWAKKQDMKDFEHVLLPRSTGLLYVLQELGGTVDWVYDCTIAYEGIPRGQYASTLFTLRSTFLQGRPPKSVNMHWRRIALSSIPLPSNPNSEPSSAESEAFASWLLSQWRIKEDLIEHYALNGRFPADQETGFVETQVKLRSIWEVGHIFGATAIITLISIVLVALWNLVRWGDVWGLG